MPLKQIVFAENIEQRVEASNLVGELVWVEDSRGTGAD